MTRFIRKILTMSMMDRKRQRTGSRNGIVPFHLSGAATELCEGLIRISTGNIPFVVLKEGLWKHKLVWSEDFPDYEKPLPLSQFNLQGKISSEVMAST